VLFRKITVNGLIWKSKLRSLLYQNLCGKWYSSSLQFESKRKEALFAKKYWFFPQADKVVTLFAGVDSYQP